MLSWRFRNKKLHEVPVSCVTAGMSTCSSGLRARWICTITLYRMWMDILVFVKSRYLQQIHFLIKYHDPSSVFNEISCVTVWQQFKIERRTVTELYRSNAPINRGAAKSLARPTSRCILFDGENISFDASLVICINRTSIPPIMIINRIYETQNLLSL